MKSIYLNHAGTSWPKPPAVLQAVQQAIKRDPVHWSEQFSQSHQVVADFLHCDKSRLLLTPSCTAALQLAILDHPWQAGDRVLTSRFEHHALHRNLSQLSRLGVEVDSVAGSETEPLQLDHLETELSRGRVRLVAVTAASNVTGVLLPYREVIQLAHRFGALALIDGAQLAGWCDLDLTDLEVDLFTFAGHKAPQAPWGIGGLYVSPRAQLSCPSAACELNDNLSASPVAMPGYCDAGSVNLVALAGMEAAVRFLSEPAQQGRLEMALDRACQLTDELRELPGVRLLGDVPRQRKLPTVALTAQGRSLGELARALKTRGIIASAGFQCAPEAHRTLKTSEHGCLRFSFAASNLEDDVNTVVDILREQLA